MPATAPLDQPHPIDQPHPADRAVRPATALPWSAFAALLRRLGERAEVAAPGGALVVAVDGYSGAGKTWVATRLADALGATLLHVDEFVPGWHGLDEGVRALGRDLVGPWSRGEPGHPQVFDWDADALGPRLTLPAPRVAVLEGSGIASLGPGSGLSARVWVHAAPAVRAQRLDGRADRVAYLPHRTTWARQEEALAARRDTPRRCDVRVVRASVAGVQLAGPPNP